MTDVVLTRGTIMLDAEHCKGCELCVLACPPQVLSMSEERNAMGARLPQLAPGCTGCQACQLVCPDYCLAVYKLAEPVVEPIAPAAQADPT